MKHARKAILFMIILVTPLLLAGVLPTAINDEVKATISPIITKVSLPSYEDMTPILAYNDFDMDNYASSLEWDGDGSPGDPYIIEGYNITSNSDSILIHDTTRAFEIRNCLITSYTGTSGNGIMIDNATQAAIVDTVVWGKSNTIVVRNVPTLYIENCTIYDGSSSIYIYNCTGATITECDIYDNFHTGIFLTECNSSMISNNEISGTVAGSGIILMGSHHVTIIGNHMFDCAASGVWAISSPHATIENNIIHDNMFDTGHNCGVHLEGSDYASIVGNEIFDNARNGIFLDHSDWAYIFDNDIYGNSEHGIDSIFSSNGTILQNDIHSNGWWPTMTNSLCGIYLWQSDDYVISDNTIWNNTPSGISLENADNITITNNVIFNNTDFGIFGDGVDESVILENQIYGMGWSDTTSDDPCGIYLDTSGGGIGHMIANNEIYGNDGHGIFLYNGENHVIDSNIIHHNNFSIYVNIDGGVNVTNNIVYDNSIGILLESGGDSWIYGNDFGWNDVNALDVSSDLIHWTDNVSIGNWWSDYSGVGEYNITDGDDVKGTDFYPSISLNLTQANPITFEILATGIVEWEAYALNPSHYELFIDGSFVIEAPWDGDDIAINVDSLSHGTHTIGIEVFHISGHSMENGTTADVEDLTPPSSIDGPIHITLTVGENVTAQYSAFDPSGIDEWIVNDTVYFAIDSTGHLTNIADLPVGEYAVRIMALDPYGHSTSYVVTITVVAAAGVPTELLLAIGAGGAIVVLIVVVIFKKRGT